MRRTTGCVALLMAGLALLALAATPAPAQTPGFETYVVRHGDTLSGIAGRIFGDPKRWREILKANPQVTNANKIYPGDSLQVPVPATATDAAGADGGLAARAGSGDALAGQVVDAGADAAGGPGGDEAAGAAGTTDGEADGAGPGEADGAEAGAEAGTGEPATAAEPVRPARTVNPALYRSAGYLADGLPELAIVAGQDERLMLASGDAAIVNAPVTPGTRFTVVRADRRVFHPKTGLSLGWLIRVLGTAEVTCRDEATSTVVLRGMRDAASIGDYLVPVDPDDILDDDRLAARVIPGCLAAGPEDAVIVAFDEDRLAVSELDLAFLDKGSDGCVAPGQRFTIYREIAAGGRLVLGELQVLRVGRTSATALVTTSVQEVLVGDLLRIR